MSCMGGSRSAAVSAGEGAGGGGGGGAGSRSAVRGQRWGVGGVG